MSENQIAFEKIMHLVIEAIISEAGEREELNIETESVLSRLQAELKRALDIKV